jgi:sterol desaturase/sphingolipid hydroxylase (fatty acid hydroxylase superfamily)
MTATGSSQLQSVMLMGFPMENLIVNGINGIKISTVTFVATVILELWCLDTVKKVLKQPGAGMPLYNAAIFANIRNHFVFGWPIYAVAATLFCSQDSPIEEQNDQVGLYLSRAGSISTMLMVHSVLFYMMHRAFHSYPSLYCHHRFHHRFNVDVSPMAANAVSVVEYVGAYILPFTVTMPFVRPDVFSLQASVFTVAMTNLFVHTPKLSNAYSKICPAWFVSTEDHLEHHRKLNTKYAAPTLNVDYFVALANKAQKHNKVKHHMT